MGGKSSCSGGIRSPGGETKSGTGSSSPMAATTSGQKVNGEDDIGTSLLEGLGGSVDEEYQYGSDDVMLDGEGIPGAGDRCEPARNGLFQTVSIIISIYVGLGLMAQPYALKLSGWAGVGSLGVSAVLLYASAIFLVNSVDSLSSIRNLHDTSNLSLPYVGHVLAGRYGRKTVAFIAMLELGGNLIICILITLQQIEWFLPIPDGFICFCTSAAVFLCILVPLLLLKNLSVLTPIAAVGGAASALLAVAVVSLVVFDHERSLIPKKPVAGHCVFDFFGILQSMGIFSLSLAGHSTLPTVRESMKRPEDFGKAISIAYVLMSTLYVSVAVCGYYYWGDSVTAIALHDLVTNSPYSSDSSSGLWWHLIPLEKMLPLMVLASCLAKIPVFAIVIQDLGVEFFIYRTYSNPYRLRQQLQFWMKFAISIMCLSVAILTRKKTGSFVSFIGGFCSMTMSLMLPILIFARLSWRHRTIPQRTALVAVGMLSLAIISVVTVLNLQTLFDDL